ncbi:hypothetical protein Leryth_014207 [Lithospermum erythrorhizon]|nr:hypothetical protein Leryth_014207 [Lithospermum erythrorhizon]
MLKDSFSGEEIMLFGVRVKVDPMRKSVSMNNLSEYEQIDINNTIKNEDLKAVAEDNGYASADDVVPNQSSVGKCIKERKRGVPWTEEEHKLFLLGLQKVGKGDWRGISRNFVKSRTPTQVASHAQKYFLRRNNLNRRRRRSSLFDITTDSVSCMPMEECNDPEGNLIQQVTVPAPQNPTETMTFGKVDQPNNGLSMLVPVFPIPTSSSSLNVDLNLNHRSEMESTQLSLGLSLSSGQGQSSSTRQSTFQLMPRFGNGESIISVA